MWSSQATKISSRLTSLSRTIQRNMASTHQVTPQPAPWKTTFLEHLGQMDSPEFVFSSLAPAPNKDSPSPYLPRARYCIYRGMWAELPENKHNDAPKNDRVFESEMPTFTTDVRMGKTFEVFSSSSGHAKDESQAQGSGGGGPCEAVWWIKGDTKVQWRMKGEAFIVGPDIEGNEGSHESSGVRTVRSELGSRMRVVKEDGKEDWSWKKEVTGHFGNLSPGMRGSFKAPPPGQPVDKPFDDGKYKLGDKVEDLENAAARENFRIVVIKPEEMESVDLSDPSKSRRQVYKYDEKTGEWSHQECWP